jgi:DNA-binding transcriptional LysR family regulator
MTLEQLRIFAAVAEREHVTRAAKALNLTQSAVSAAIAALEERHSVALFNRVGRRIELTEAGRLFLDEARAVLARAQAAELALSEIAGVERGVLTIYASQTIASYWLPARLASFHLMHPRITINLIDRNTSEVARAVHDGSADLGFVEGHVEADDLVQQVVARDRLTLVVAPTHPWAERQSIDEPDLMDASWVLRDRGSGTRAQFEDVLKRWNLSVDKLNVVLELPSNEAVRTAVEAGAGATMISRLGVEPSLGAGLLKAVAFDVPERAFTALRHRERYFNNAAKALLNDIRGVNGRGRAVEIDLSEHLLDEQETKAADENRGRRTQQQVRSRSTGMDVG